MRAKDSASARKPLPPGTSTVSNGTSPGTPRLMRSDKAPPAGAWLLQPVSNAPRSPTMTAWRWPPVAPYGKVAHLNGLNFSRAWCFRALAHALPVQDASGTAMRAAAGRHLGASMPHLTSDYMGEHWLASFALLALEA